MSRPLLPPPWRYQADYLGAQFSKLLLRELNALPLQRPSIMLFGKTHTIPREQIWLGEEGCSYQYSKLVLQPTPFPMGLAALKDKLNHRFSCQLNACLVNFYQDGHAHMGWHSDNEPEIVPNSDIFILSLGATRELAIRAKTTKQRWLLPLQAGSILQMQAPMQRDYEHALPKRLRVKEARFSLTFRQVTPHFYASIEAGR